LKRKYLYIVASLAIIAIAALQLTSSKSLEYIKTPDYLLVTTKAQADELDAIMKEVGKMNEQYGKTEDLAMKKELEGKLTTLMQNHDAIMQNRKRVNDKLLIDKLFTELRKGKVSGPSKKSDSNANYYSIELHYYNVQNSQTALNDGYIDKISILEDGTVIVPKYSGIGGNVSIMHTKISTELMEELEGVLKTLSR